MGSLRHGGAEKVLVTFLKNLPKDKYEIDLLLNLYSGKYLSEVPEWINVLYLNKGEMITTNRIQDIPEKAYRKIFQAILKKFPKLLYTFILKGKKYDIEFAAIHGFRDEILNSPLRNSKKIVWIHNDLRKTEFHDYTDDEIRKFFGFDKIMVISEQIQQDFEHMAPNEYQKSKVVRIYNPLDTQEILSKAEFQSIEYSFHSEVPVFVSIGTVFPQKGYDRLLKVHKKLIDEGFQHRLLILGDGYDFENIKNLKSELGVDETATLLGFTDNPYPFLKKADFFVLSSRYEGFPTVLFEAIVLKKKIIATDVSGVREMLLNGELGEIVENSEEGIYRGMKKALTDPFAFEGYKDALDKYEAPFSLENSVAGIQKILDEL
ncbi:MAG: glycosyltransferase [Weeksellaceae bacterium]